MMNSEQYREHIERTFNAFCKIVLYHAALGIYKKIRRKQQFEVSLDYLREFDFEPIATTDEYFVKYDMPTTFTVRGETVIVESEQLAAALLRLPEKRREVLFLRYYLGYSDTEIGRLWIIFIKLFAVIAHYVFYTDIFVKRYQGRKKVMVILCSLYCLYYVFELYRTIKLF